jgi:hypothetical protein
VAPEASRQELIWGDFSLLENSHETDEVFNIAEVKQA